MTLKQGDRKMNSVDKARFAAIRNLLTPEELTKIARACDAADDRALDCATQGFGEHATAITDGTDHSRGVDGEVELAAFDEFDRAAVMYWYDHGASSTSRSWRDGFLIGGCNSKFVG